MIKLNDRWFIDVDAYNYTLQKRLNSVVKRGGVNLLDENGNPVYQFQSVGYYSSLSKALEAFARIYTREALINGSTMSLDESIQTIERCKVEVADMMKTITKGE